MASPIIYAAIYFIIVVFGSCFYFRGRVKNVDDFTTGGKTLKWYMVASGLALIPLGSGHTMNLWEASAGLGCGVLFWPVIVGGIFLPLATLWFGPWLRELGVQTFPESLEMQFGAGMGYLNGAVNTATWTGICMGETLATGGAIYGLTSGAIPFKPWCIIIAFVLIMVYVIFGGVLQYSIVSTVNATVMIVGSYVALILTGGWLSANAMGWTGVVEHYNALDQTWKLEIFRFSPDLLFQIVLPVAILHITAAAVTQGVYIPIFAAKSTQEVRKATFMAALINGLSSFPWVMMGIAAMTIPAIAAGGAKLSVINHALQNLPAPIVGLLMVCLLAATLSTGSSVMLGNATVIVNVILKRACFPKMKPETEFRLMRPMIVVCGLAACVPALVAPMIFPIFLWCFSFGIPMFFVWLVGMVWKCSKSAAWTTIIVTYILNFVWTFATPSWATGYWGLNVYPVVICSIVLTIVLNLVLPGDSGLLARHREANNAAQAA